MNPPGNSMINLQIRRLTPRDAEQWLAVRRLQTRAEPHRDDLVLRLRAETVFGAFFHGRLSGVVRYWRRAADESLHVGTILGLFVRPMDRNIGIGSELVMHAMAHAVMDGVEMLTLSVEEGNDAAIRVYEELGFEVYGIEPKSVKRRDRYRNTILMSAEVRRALPAMEGLEAVEKSIDAAIRDYQYI